MSDDKAAAHEELAERLANHTGVTVEQARELIRMLGVDWSSLVREATALRRAKR